MFTKITKQKFENLKNIQPSLYDNINKFLPNLDTDSKGIVAGLVIEYVIKSGGNTDVFYEDIIASFSKEDNDNENEVYTLE